MSGRSLQMEKLTSGLEKSLDDNTNGKTSSLSTCVKDVASLTENGTSRTLARVRANRVLPTGLLVVSTDQRVDLTHQNLLDRY